MFSVVGKWFINGTSVSVRYKKKMEYDDYTYKILIKKRELYTKEIIHSGWRIHKFTGEIIDDNNNPSDCLISGYQIGKLTFCFQWWDYSNYNENPSEETDVFATVVCGYFNDNKTVSGTWYDTATQHGLFEYTSLDKEKFSNEEGMNMNNEPKPKQLVKLKREAEEILSNSTLKKKG